MSCCKARFQTSSPSASSVRSDKERVKKWHPKTRNGCVTCKSRRVKCDQGRPRCENCVNVGRPCIYDVPRALVFEPGKSSSLPKPALILSFHSISDDYAVSTRQQAREFLQKFLRGTDNYERFWTYHFPQISEFEEPLGHIGLCLAARYCSVFRPPATADHVRLSNMANKHFAEGVRQLAAPGKKFGPEIMLISCLAFMTFEKVSDTISNSFIHLRASQNILREWKTERQVGKKSFTRSSIDLIESVLQPLLTRFEPLLNPVVAAKAFSNPWEPIKSRPPPPQLPNVFHDISIAVSTLREIAEWLQTEAAPHLMFLEAPYLELQESLRLMSTWRTLFRQYRGTNLQVDSKVHKFLIMALEANYLILLVLIKSTAIPNELLSGLQSDELGAALQICQKLASQHSPNGDEDCSEAFKLLPRLGPAVFVVGLFARRPILKRQAIEYLRKIHTSFSYDETSPSDQCLAVSILEGHFALETGGKTNEDTALLLLNSRIRLLKADLTAGNPGQILLTYTRPVVRPQVRTQVTSIDWYSTVKPPVNEIWLWPPTELLKWAGPAGLLGSTDGQCMCRTYGSKRWLFSFAADIDTTIAPGMNDSSKGGNNTSRFATNVLPIHASIPPQVKYESGNVSMVMPPHHESG